MAASSPVMLYTDCKLRVDSGQTPTEGTFLLTKTDRAYLVNRVAGKTLHCTRWPRSEVPDDAEVLGWSWSRR